MKVELSEQAQRRVEQMVDDGMFPSAEAVVEAALEEMEHPEFAGIDVRELDKQARATRAAGNYRMASEEYLAEIRAKAQAIIDSKRSR